METIVKINEVVNGIVWGVPIMLLILGTGIYYTIRFGFIQFRHPVWLVKQTIIITTIMYIRFLMISATKMDSKNMNKQGF